MPEIAKPALRYHGSKFRLAPWLLGFLPVHRTYIEAFGGAAGLLLRKPPSDLEVYNDLDEEIVGFFRVLRDPVQRAALTAAISLTPYARREFETAFDATLDPVERARRVVIRAHMGFGSAGATKGRTGWRTYCGTKRPHEEWRGIPDALAAAGERLKSVVIECRDGVDLMQAHDGDDVLHFVDPPYLPETRAAGAATRCYRFELDMEGHRRLLEALLQLRGSVVLCGYITPAYAALEGAGWCREEREVRASGQRGSVARTEAVWLNPKAVRGAKQLRLIA